MVSDLPLHFTTPHHPIVITIQVFFTWDLRLSLVIYAAWLKKAAIRYANNMDHRRLQELLLKEQMERRDSDRVNQDRLQRMEALLMQQFGFKPSIPPPPPSPPPPPPPSPALDPSGDRDDFRRGVYVLSYDFYDGRVAQGPLKGARVIFKATVLNIGYHCNNCVLFDDQLFDPVVVYLKMEFEKVVGVLVMSMLCMAAVGVKAAPADQVLGALIGNGIGNGLGGVGSLGNGLPVGNGVLGGANNGVGSGNPLGSAGSVAGQGANGLPIGNTNPAGGALGGTGLPVHLRKLL
ncbi:hypothetical protein Sjap_005210 [Stephania japonica]|uniref:Uncharacterized protein n=1 Tax=Stephania japonica TaxID=461633 RepID=A0AAP0K5X4_9MAGN